MSAFQSRAGQGRVENEWGQGDRYRGWKPPLLCPPLLGQDSLLQNTKANQPRGSEQSLRSLPGLKTHSTQNLDLTSFTLSSNKEARIITTHASDGYKVGPGQGQRVPSGQGCYCDRAGARSQASGPQPGRDHTLRGWDPTVCSAPHHTLEEDTKMA